MERIKRTRPAAPVARVSRTRSRETYVAPEPEEVEGDDETGGEELAESADDCARIISKYKERATTPLKAIRAFCISCMGGQVREVGRCTATSCVLFGYRMGSKPKS